MSEDGGVALVAVGGYGRGDLSPHSDLDILFVNRPRADVRDEVLKAILYPLWDAGFALGHAVVSPAGAVDRAERDLHAATSLLTARFVAGDRSLVEDLERRRDRWLARRKRQVLLRLTLALKERHEGVQRLGWTLAPHLKEDAGGLRDVHAIGWLAAAGGEVEPLSPAVVEARSLLLAAREALHGELPRPSDRIRSDLQATVAERLGFAGEQPTHQLMILVHRAGRVIESEVKAAMEKVQESMARGPRRSGSSAAINAFVRLEDGYLTTGSSGAEAALALVAAHSTTGRPVARRALATAKDSFEGQVRWSGSLLASFCELLEGGHALAALEMLDDLGAMTRLMPEWSAVRGQIQNDPWHRFTVDGHLFTTVAETRRSIEEDPVAAAAVREAEATRSLFVAALLHDIGKGSGGDHSIEGEAMARRIASRIGLSAEEVDAVAALVRHHLLLADTATRRDTDDPAVLAGVARLVGSPDRLRLLYVLTRADGLATGPLAWGDWKQSLVADLYRKVISWMESEERGWGRTGEAGSGEAASEAGPGEEGQPREGRSGGAPEGARMLESLPPSYAHSSSSEEIEQEMELLLRAPEQGEVGVAFRERSPARGSLSVCFRDRPGALARTAGVLALHRVDVLGALAYSTSDGLALERFEVELRPP